MTELFQKNTTANVHLFLLIILSIILMTADRHGHYISTLRSYLSVVVTPFYYIVHLPLDRINQISDAIVRHNNLLVQNNVLRKKNLLLNGRLKSLNILRDENSYLRELLLAGPQLAQHFEIVKVMSSNLDPFQQQFMINKGTDNGIIIGLSLFDERGVIGQVVEARKIISRVMMITDSEHILPVEIKRSHFRTMAKGTGNGKLSLLYMNLNSTNLVKEGDEVITSGQGGRFPSGYPVGIVTLIRSEIGLPYAHAQVQVSSKLKANRMALVAWPNNIDRPAIPENIIRPRETSLMANEMIDPILINILQFTQ